MLLRRESSLVALLTILGLLMYSLIACAAPAAAPTAAPTKVAQPIPTKAAEPTAIKPSAETTPTPKPAAAKQTSGGTLRLVTQTDPVGWEPHGVQKVSVYTTRAISFVYSRLLQFPAGPRFEPGGQIDPLLSDLAESWEVPNDTTYIFHLRKGVKWQNKPPVNGREFVAQDVKWTLERLIAQSPEKRLLEGVTSIETPDNYTVKFTTKEPFAPFLTNIAATNMVMLAQEAGEKTPEGGRDFTKETTVVGTGPFMLESYQKNVRAVFKKNPTYFRQGMPYVDQITWTIVPDASTRIALLRAKNLDIMGDTSTNRIDRILLADLQRTNPDIVNVDYLPPRVSTNLFMRIDQPPFNDKRVRQAVSMAIDRKTWIDSFFQGRAINCTAVAPALKDWAVPADKLGEGAKYYEYNPTEAKRLLAEAGHPNGLKVPYVSTTGYGVIHVEQAELIKDNLAKVGIDADLKLQEYTAWLASTYTGKYDGIAYGPSMALGDPDEYLWTYAPGDVRNHSHVDDPKLNEMLKKERTTVDRAERMKLVQEIQKYIAAEVYRIFLPLETYIGSSQPWVKDFVPSEHYDIGKVHEHVWLAPH